MVHGLRHSDSTAGGTGSIPGWGTSIPNAAKFLNKWWTRWSLNTHTQRQSLGSLLNCSCRSSSLKRGQAFIPGEAKPPKWRGPGTWWPLEGRSLKQHCSPDQTCCPLPCFQPWWGPPQASPWPLDFLNLCNFVLPQSSPASLPFHTYFVLFLRSRCFFPTEALPLTLHSQLKSSPFSHCLGMGGGGK